MPLLYLHVSQLTFSNYLLSACSKVLDLRWCGLTFPGGRRGYFNVMTMGFAASDENITLDACDSGILADEMG